MPASGVPFSIKAAGVALSATSTSSNVQLPTSSGNSILVCNEGPNIAFMAVGPTSAGAVATLPTGTGATTCMQIPSGSVQTFTRDPNNDLWIAAICRSTGTAVLSIYVGEGS